MDYAIYGSFIVCMVGGRVLLKCHHRIAMRQVSDVSMNKIYVVYRLYIQVYVHHKTQNYGAYI